MSNKYEKNSKTEQTKALANRAPSAVETTLKGPKKQGKRQGWKGPKINGGKANVPDMREKTKSA